MNFLCLPGWGLDLASSPALRDLLWNKPRYRKNVFPTQASLDFFLLNSAPANFAYSSDVPRATEQQLPGLWREGFEGEAAALSCSWGWQPGGFPGNPGFVWAVLWGFSVVLQMLGIPVLCPAAGGHCESGSIHHLQDWFGCHIPALRFAAGSGGTFSHIPLQRLTHF